MRTPFSLGLLLVAVGLSACSAQPLRHTVPEPGKNPPPPPSRTAGAIERTGGLGMPMSDELSDEEAEELRKGPGATDEKKADESATE